MKFVSVTQDEQYKQEMVPLLIKLAQEKLSPHQVLKVLTSFKIFTSMKRSPQRKNEYQITYKSLMKEYKDDIPQIFAKISKIVLDNKEEMNLQILQSKKQGQVSFNKKQMVYLMALMALNLVPYQQYEQNFKPRSRFPSPNEFSFIFQEERYKTRTIIEYFKDYFKNQSQNQQEENFTIRRQVLQEDIKDILKKNSQLPMQEYKIVSDQDSIEDYYGHAKVDFANKYIGGGALHSGCVQQEIMFSNHPQLFTSVIFCEVMEPNEALFLTGYKKYSQNQGYGWTTAYKCQQNIQYQKDQRNRAKQYIIAVDAVHFGNKWKIDQVSKQLIDRQLRKAYVGFNIPEKVDIITGNWGCGAFNGQIRTKFLIQWLACSLAHKKMVYCPFGSKSMLEKNQKVLSQLRKRNVGQVYNLLIKGGNQMKSMENNIFDKIAQLL